MFVYVFIIILFSITFSSTAVAAKFTLVNHSYCNARLDGEIYSDDLESIIPFLNDEFFTDNSDGIEAAISSRICLNSPGGNLDEATKIGQYFYEKGIGTFINSGDSCLSACAFVFMMGTALGGEDASIDRAMHPKGIIGFHRPTISIPELPTYTSSLLKNSFDAAINSVYKLISLGLTATPKGGGQMIKPDLLKEALNRSGSDFFFIDTVDKIGRWDIDLVEYIKPTSINKLYAWNACHNLLAWKSNQNTSHQQFNNDVHSDRVEVLIHSEQKFAYRIQAMKMADIPTAGDWFEALCIIGKQNNYASGCGYSNQNNTQFGSENCYKNNVHPPDVMTTYFKQFAVYSPTTKLSDIAVTDPKSENNKNLEYGVCSILKSNTLFESDSCSKSSITNSRTINSYIWPSGGKTIVTLSRTGIYTLNGNITEVQEHKEHGKCFENPKTGNTFCFARK